MTQPPFLSRPQVVKFKTESDVTKEKAYFKWMQRQQTYYGDLLKKGKHPGVDAILERGTLEEKRELLEALRQAAAVARPEMQVSHSQATHG
jgi:hypothetical protein